MPRIADVQVAGFLLLLAACAGKDTAPRQHAALDPVPATLPLLRLVVSSQLPNGPEDPGQEIAVSEKGSMSFAPLQPEDERRIRVIDSAGNILAVFGHSGRGPGEVQMPGRLFYPDSGVAVYDMANLRLTWYSQTGRVRGERQFDGVVFPFAVHGDSVDAVTFEQGLFAIAREPLVGRQRMWVRSDDTVLKRTFTGPFIQSPRDEQQLHMPAAASTVDRLVLGDGLRYRLYQYDHRGRMVGAFGRDLEPEHMSARAIAKEKAGLAKYHDANGHAFDQAQIDRMIRQMREKRMPYFSHIHSLAFDEAGRLWVVGMSSDSVFADIFADTLFMGRLNLGCADFAQRWSLSGHWLVVLCGSADESESTVTLKLFEVRDSVGL